MWSSLLLIAVCTGATNAALPLPSYIKPCSRNDPNLYDCSVKHGNAAISHVLKGDSKYKIPPFDPLKIDEVKVVDGGGSNVGITMVLNNASIHGLKDVNIEKAEYDFKKKHILHQVFIPRVEVIGKYEVRGRVLLLPINGQGDVNITLDNCRVTYNSDFIYEIINGKEHFSHQNEKAIATPTNMHIELTNLFNGDKLLSKQMNEFLNENWRDVFKELSPTLFSVFTEIISSVFKGLDRAVPVDEIFPEKVDP